MITPARRRGLEIIPDVESIAYSVSMRIAAHHSKLGALPLQHGAPQAHASLPVFTDMGVQYVVVADGEYFKAPTKAVKSSSRDQEI